MVIDNDGIINNSQNKILLRTERLLENNHNLEKILDNLLEQVCFVLRPFFLFSSSILLLRLILLKKAINYP
jgi:hypothetical protein